MITNLNVRKTTAVLALALLLGGSLGSDSILAADLVNPVEYGNVTCPNNFGLHTIDTERELPSTTVQANNGLVYTVNHGDESGDVTVTDLKTSKVVKQISLGNDLATNKIIAPEACVTDGDYVYAIGGYYQSVFTIDTKTNTLIKQVDSPTGANNVDNSFESATIDVKNHHIYIGGEDNQIYSYNTTTSKFDKAISLKSIFSGQNKYNNSIIQEVFYDAGNVYFGGQVGIDGNHGAAAAVVGVYNVSTNQVKHFKFPGVNGLNTSTDFLGEATGIQGLDVVHIGKKTFLYETSHVRQGELNIFDLTTEKVVASYNKFEKTLNGRPHSVVSLPNGKIGVGVQADDGSYLTVIDTNQNTDKGGKIVNSYLVVPKLNNKVNLHVVNNGQTIISPDRTEDEGKLWIYNNPAK